MALSILTDKPLMDGLDGQEWPSTASGYRECAALEDAVLCSICRDYFNTPLSLLCGHSCKPISISSADDQDRAMHEWNA